MQRKFMPDLFELFEKTADPRNPCYITYPNRMMLGQIMLWLGDGLVSSLGSEFIENDEKYRQMSAGKGKQRIRRICERNGV